MAVIRYRL